MGRCAIGISKAFERLKPDAIVVLGDRYELLPICSSALIMGIPIAHISGGDITEGVIDDQIRHAITKMAHLHFPGTEESARRIMQMGEDPKRIFVAGELGIDNFKRIKRITRRETADVLGLDQSNKWILFTYHPETAISIKKNLKRVSDIFSALRKVKNTEVVVTYPNADYGGRQIIELLKKECLLPGGRFQLIKNLGQLMYINLMCRSHCIIGNSSSGITESPSAGIPAINIGNRQKGRIIPGNVICANGGRKSVSAALRKAFSSEFRDKSKYIKNPYDKGGAAENIVRVFRKVSFWETLLSKKFIDSRNEKIF